MKTLLFSFSPDILFNLLSMIAVAIAGIALIRQWAFEKVQAGLACRREPADRWLIENPWAEDILEMMFEILPPILDETKRELGAPGALLLTRSVAITLLQGRGISPDEAQSQQAYLVREWRLRFDPISTDARGKVKHLAEQVRVEFMANPCTIYGPVILKTLLPSAKGDSWQTDSERQDG